MKVVDVVVVDDARCVGRADVHLHSRRAILAMELKRVIFEPKIQHIVACLAELHLRLAVLDVFVPLKAKSLIYTAVLYVIFAIGGDL